MTKDLVSVCIPVFNSELTIKNTIASALCQTYTNLELVIVDNHSTDRTWEVINSITDSRIKKFQNDSNIGMTGNWNKCLEHASGEYIHFLCGDDLISPDCIEKKMSKIKENENIVMVFSASDVINENGKTVLHRAYSIKDCVLDGVKLAKKAFLFRNIYGEPSNVLFRKNLLQKTGVFPTNVKYSIDLDLWIRLSCQGKVAFVSEPLMKYRISKSNGTSTFTVKTFATDDKVFVENIIRYGYFNISFFTKMVHFFIHKQRMRIRLLFIKLKS